MPAANVQTRSVDFQPTAVGTGQTKSLFSVAKGTRVWAASAQMLIPAAASTDSTMVLGDTAATNGFIAAIDLEATAAGTVVAGAGAHLAASGGKLYTAAGTVDVVYAGTTWGATNPKVRFTIIYSRDFPGPGPG